MTCLLITINPGSKGTQCCKTFHTVYKHKILTYISIAVSYQFKITLLFTKYLFQNRISGQGTGWKWITSYPRHTGTYNFKFSQQINDLTFLGQSATSCLNDSPCIYICDVHVSLEFYLQAWIWLGDHEANAVSRQCAVAQRHPCSPRTKLQAA
jgi:hypothetical protein